MPLNATEETELSTHGRNLETHAWIQHELLQPTKIRTVDDWAESDLAWELADAISSLLAGRDRAQLYATIGSGESYTAIDAMLQTIVHQHLPIPTQLITKLTDWLDAYAHSDDAPRLHELLHAIKAVR